LLGSVGRALVQQQVGAVSDATLMAPLNPAYRYLRVQLSGGAPALLVLGYLESDPGGEVEVWYSARRELIKIQNGRLVGSAGLASDWRNVRYSQPPPAWQALRGTASYTRWRDVMPGYHYGLVEQLTLQAAETPPPPQVTSLLSPGQVKAYVWYRESGSTPNALPQAWFALSATEPRELLYAYQCLTAQLCLQMQAWPAEKAAS
jgi:hypothetical protein